MERLVKRRRDIASDERAEPLTDDETSEWETLLGKAACDENLFARKRKDAEARQKLGELKDARKVASLPRQPLLAESGAIQLPRFVFRWLVGDEAREGAWTLMDLGLLVGLLGAFENRDPSILVDAHFEEQDDEVTLVVPAGTGSQMRFDGLIAGSPLEDGSGFIRGREALAVLVRNEWFEVAQTVAELRIRLGERAKT